MRGVLCVYVCVCVCVCVRAAFDLHDFLDTEGVLCVCERTTFDLLDFFDAEGVLCIWIHTMNAHKISQLSVCVCTMNAHCTQWVHTTLLNWHTNTAAYRMSISDLSGRQMKTLHTMNKHNIPQLFITKNSIFLNVEESCVFHNEFIVYI